MKKLKSLAKLLCFLFVFSLIFIFVAPQLIDARVFSPALTDAVKERTGRNLSFNGPISFSILPQFKIKAQNVALSNAEGFQPEDMLSIGEVQAGVEILPLLRRKLELGQIELRDTEFHYGINGEGQDNLADILKGASTAEENTGGGSFSFANVGIAGLIADNSTLSYTDEASGRQVRAELFNLETSKIEKGIPIKLRISATTAGTVPEFLADFNLQTTLDVVDKNILLDNLSGSVSYRQGEAQLETDVSTGIAIDMANAVVKTFGLAIDTTLTLPDGKLAFSGEADINYKTNEGSLEVSNLALNSGDMSATGFLSASGLKDIATVDGEFSTNIFSIRPFLEDLGFNRLLDTADRSAYGNASASAQFIMADNKLSLPFSMVIDDTSIVADISADMTGEKPLFKVPVKVSAIDIDRYLPSVKAEEIEKLSSTANDLEITLPQLDLGSYPDIDLDISIASFLAKGVSVGDFAMTGRLRAASFDLSSLSADFFGGTLNASGRLTGIKDKPLSASLTARMSETNLQEVLTLFAPSLPQEGLPKRASFILQASLADNIAKITNSEIRLDELILKADVEADLRNKLSVRADVNVNDVVLDKYSIFSNKPAERDDLQMTEAPELDAMLPAAGSLPLNTLTGAGFNLVANLKINSISFRNTIIHNVSSRLLLRDRIARLAPTTASFYKGNMQADITVLRRGIADFTNYITISMTSVSAGELVSAVGNTQNPFLTGTLSAHMSLNAKGLLIGDVLSTLNGKVSYNVNNGVIHGFIFNPDILTADMMNTSPEDKITPIDAVSGSGTVKDGMLYIDPLWVNANYMSASMEGGLGFVDRSLNFGGNVRLSEAQVPFDIKGSFTEPQFHLDEADLRGKLIIELTKKTGAGLLQIPVKILKGTSNIVESVLDSMLPKE